MDTTPLDHKHGAELRVHGIGDHQPLSALGANPWTSGDRSKRFVVHTVAAPVLPRHRLHLLNWSRTSRAFTAGILWALAFPMTLVNVAGEMVPAKGSAASVRAPLLRFAVWIVGLVVTVVMAAWLVVLLETVANHIPLGDVRGELARHLILAIVWALLAGGAVGRRFRQRASVTSLRVLISHIVALTVFCLALAWYPPTKLSYAGWPSFWIPNNGDSARYLDPMTALVVLSTAFVAAVVLVLLVVGTRSGAPTLAAAGFLMITGVVLAHCLNALIRSAVDALLGYFIAPATIALEPTRTSLMAYDDPRSPIDFRIDLLPFNGIFLALVLVAVAYVLSGIGRSLPDVADPERSRTVKAVERFKGIHRAVVGLPEILPRVMLLSGTLGFAVSFVIFLTVKRFPFETGVYLSRLTHLIALIAFSLLLLRPRRLRRTLGYVADVVGFWPVRSHPLSGIAYRDAVLSGIDKGVRDVSADVVALVGHSQGSVLCAWYACKGSAGVIGLQNIHLVTCGSPLTSLYATFFPAHFDDDFFRGVKESVESWSNFWRATDPIATEVADAANIELTAYVDVNGGVLSHGDYWVAPEQCAAVRDVLAVPVEPGPEPRVRPSVS